MLTLCVLMILLACVGCVCERSSDTYDEDFVRQVDSIVNADRSIDSLVVVLERFEEDGNEYGIVASCRELGRSYRNASMFSEALDIHKKGLSHALELKDTISIIQALNNIGTDFRRMGILDEASDYHYQALGYSSVYSDTTSQIAIKNRVISLNGIGNVHLSLGNHEVAETVFRQALAGEASLGSFLGQAINYANIGAILESRGQIDSARYYYSESLRCNMEAGSDLGISLCHTYFGRLYENEGRFDDAVREYKIAYEIMSGSKDKWHWLESCLALSRVYAADSRISLARRYLSEAKAVAEKINSAEHLTEVYRQEYNIERELADYRKALDAYIKSSEYGRQVTNEKNLTHMQNVRVRYERERKAAEISHLHQTWQTEKHSRNIILITVIVSLVLSLITIAFLIYIIYLRSKNQKMMKEIERTRTNFFTNITHEFRTPLTIIISAAQDIQVRNRADKTLQRDSTDIICHGKVLLDLVNQILDIAKISSGLAVTPP